MTTWLEALVGLREQRRAGVLVPVLEVRGHAPREAGTKMVVADDETWGTVGGGNLEASAVERARALIARGGPAPARFTLGLSEHAPYGHGRQCCGGEVEVLLEPLPVVPAVAVFGVGHVGIELARVLARQDLDLHLVDSRAEAVAPTRLAVLDDAVARVEAHHAPLPELVLSELPRGTHVLVLTHDHAEDHALVDAARRVDHLGSLGRREASFGAHDQTPARRGVEPDLGRRVPARARWRVR